MFRDDRLSQRINIVLLDLLAHANLLILQSSSCIVYSIFLNKTVIYKITCR